MQYVSNIICRIRRLNYSIYDIMKKTLSFLTFACIFITLFLCIAPQTGGASGESLRYEIVPSDPGIKYIIDGAEIDLKTRSDPENGETLTPVRELAKALGMPYHCNVFWHSVSLFIDGKAHLFFMADKAPEDEDALYVKSIDGIIYAPLYRMCRIANSLILSDEERGVVYITTGVKKAAPKGVRVPVLMYHAVSDNILKGTITELYVKPAELRKQIDYLVTNGYTPITFEDMHRIDSIKKPVILTFDDGYLNNYEELFPILKEFNVKATVFMITDAIEYAKEYLDADMIKEMSDSGLVSIQSHTVTHPDLKTLSSSKIKSELQESQLALARCTGRIPFVICYPMGRYTDAAVRQAADYYIYGTRISGGVYNTSNDRLLVSRIYISRDMSLAGFKSVLKS